MAYRAFDDWSRAAISNPSATRVATSVEAPVFASVELQAIAIAHSDNHWSLRPRTRWVRFAERVFGLRPANPLADPRLEALRRFAVITRLRGGRPPASDREAFLSAGFTSRQAAFVSASIPSFPREA